MTRPPRFRRLLAGVLPMLCLAAPALAFQPAQTPAGRTFAATGSVELAFTPGDDATALVVKTLAGAKRQILVQAYSFTSRDIAAALVAARRRGVDVRVIADREETEKIDRNRIAEIAAGGVPVLIDGAHAAAHNKVMVIDAGTPGAAVITGSFNFTYAAQFHNAENLLVLRGNAPLADAYAANWQRHRQHAWPYEKGRF
jgi:phosphatidylserine/phosphatidylglycerophosphate/cardiolipin synthase-like enzyme